MTKVPEQINNLLEEFEDSEFYSSEIEEFSEKMKRGARERIEEDFEKFAGSIVLEFLKQEPLRLSHIVFASRLTYLLNLDKEVSNRIGAFVLGLVKRFTQEKDEGMEKIIPSISLLTNVVRNASDETRKEAITFLQEISQEHDETDPLRWTAEKAIGAIRV